MDVESPRFVDELRKSTVFADSHFVVVGSGSAGRRHALALRALFPNAPITVVKRTSSTQPLDVLHSSNISVVRSLDEACVVDPSFAVIASPATLHRADLEHLSRHCSRFLLEKPIAADSSDGRAILSLVNQADLQVSVGHHLRFSDTPQAFFGEISHHSQSELRGIRLSYGQHLRHWRPGVPSEDSVTARRDLGGGVIRELSHEIDAAWLLGGRLERVREATVLRTGAPTDGLVDTVADFTVASEHVDVVIHLDMTADDPFRLWEANFGDVVIRADLLAGEVWGIRPDGEVQLLHKSSTAERDRAGIALMRAALGLATAGSPAPCDVPHGLRIVNTIEAVEQSAARGEPVAIRE